MDKYSYESKKFIVQLVNENYSIKSIYEKFMLRYGYNGSYESFRKFVYRLKKKNISEEVSTDFKKNNDIMKLNFINLLSKRRSFTIIELSNLFNCTPNKIIELVNEFKQEGYEINNDDHLVYMSKNLVLNSNDHIIKPLETDEIIFGVASDLHFGSKSCQITALKDFCEICRLEGVKHIFSPGDLTAGINVYPGQIYDLYESNITGQTNSLLANLPTGFQWYFLGGNHDYAFIKSTGFNVLSYMANKRDDIHYVSFDDADVPILKNVDLKMIHPSGGVPYSISYRLQKNVEQVAYNELRKLADGNNKSRIRFILAGHLHIQMQAMFGNIFGCQCGCFEGRTNYLKRKGLFPHIGGYIIKVSLNKNGQIKNFDAKFHMFDEIEDDWKNFNHMFISDESEKIKNPIF
jgi:UDP-2,3-diacylglucosamine pyrophosphatase LpxH